jgi:hypothetical protein
MRTPQWIKKLGGHAGELFVCAELSKQVLSFRKIFRTTTTW